ncbi:hypothetical protein D3C86_1446960 [compost metagenome]
MHTTGKAQTQRKRRLAAQVETVALAFEPTEQHLAVTVGDLGPAVGNKVHAHLAGTGDGRCVGRWGNRCSGTGRRNSCHWGNGNRHCGGSNHRGQCERCHARLGSCGSRRWRNDIRWCRCGSRVRVRLTLIKAQDCLLAFFGLAHGLVFRLVKLVNLGGAIGAFDFDMLHGQAGQVLAAQAGLVLPPEETATEHHDQQHQADDAQDVVRQAYRLFDAAQAVDVTALGMGAGVLVEGLDQWRLVHPQQLGVGANIATGKGVARQLVEGTGFKVGQGDLGEVQLQCHLWQRPVFALTGLAQGLTGVDASRCYYFGMRRFHHCSDRYC